MNKSKSDKLREQGNVLFRKHKMPFSAYEKKSYIHQGLRCYEMALDASKNNTEKASAFKNIAACHSNLVRLEERFASSRMACWKNALENFLSAMKFGDKSSHRKKWRDDVFKLFSDCVDSIIDSDEKNVTLREVLQNSDKIKNVPFNRYSADKFIQYGEDLISEALTLIGNKNFIKGLPLMKEIYRPIEEAKKFMARTSKVQRRENQLNTLINERNTFTAIGEALQSYYVGSEIYDDAQDEEDDSKRAKMAISSMDHLQQAMVLVKGEDAEIVAMAEGKMGLVYYNIIKNKIRAKECFNDAMNIASTLPEHGKLYSSPWYVEIATVMKEIQGKAQAEEDAKWENRRKPILDKLNENGTLSKIWEGKNIF